MRVLHMIASRDKYLVRLGRGLLAKLCNRINIEIARHIEKKPYHLNALNFIDSHTFLPSPPLDGGSTQMGQSPTYHATREFVLAQQAIAKRTFVAPRPLTNRGVYRSKGERGALGVAPIRLAL